MKRETFVSMFASLLSEADEELLREAEGLCFWRRRELRSQRVKEFSPGEVIEYLSLDGKSRLRGTIHHLNKYSVSIRDKHETQGYTTAVVQIERVLGTYLTREEANQVPDYKHLPLGGSSAQSK